MLFAQSPYPSAQSLEEEAQGSQEKREELALDRSLMLYLTLIQNFLQMFLETAGLTVDHSIWMHTNVTPIP